MHAATLSTDSYQRIAATGGSISVSTESEQSAGPGLPAHLAGAPVRHPGVAVDGHQRVVERRPVLGDADDARRRPVARAPRGPRRRATPSPHCTLRAEHVVDWATRGGARALGRDDLGSLAAGQEGRRRPDQERRLAGVVPAAEPLRPRRVPGPARRRAHRARRRPGREARRHSWSASTSAAVRRDVEATVDYLRAELGEEVWQAGMHPELPEDDKVLDNPYQYTDYKSEATHGARGTHLRRARARLTRAQRTHGRTWHGTGLRRGAGARARRAGLLRRRPPRACR